MGYRTHQTNRCNSPHCYEHIRHNHCPRRSATAAAPALRAPRPNPWLHLPGRFKSSGTRSQIATPARAAGRAIVAPVAGRAAGAVTARARAATVSWLRADPGASWRARRRRAADQPVVAGVEGARGASTPDVRAVESRPRRHGQRRNEERPSRSGNRAERSASRLARRQRSNGCVEPLTVHGSTPHSLFRLAGWEVPLLTLAVALSADKP